MNWYWLWRRVYCVRHMRGTPGWRDDNALIDAGYCLDQRISPYP